MATTKIISKRVAISNANAQMVIVIAVASFITVFCLIASKALVSENAYLSRVRSATNKTNSQLQANIKAYSSLTQSYASFVSSPKNIIGGSSNGNGSNDGNNAKIVLDALPAAYDFPGLTSTIQKLLSSHGFDLTSITGTDDELNQKNNNQSTTPKPVSMPFTFTVSNTNYQAVAQLFNYLQASIRPIVIDQITVTGGSSNLKVTVNAHTYYQPAKSVSITKKVIK